jgi:hypothetical protein
MAATAIIMAELLVERLGAKSDVQTVVAGSLNRFLALIR